jgi:hypothetical protein
MEEKAEGEESEEEGAWVRSWIQGCREENDQVGRGGSFFWVERTGAQGIGSGHSSSAAISD